MKKSTRIGLIVGAVIVAMQIVPVDRTNPPVEGVVAAPVEVYSVLERACFDCHSNETKWPWYSYIAPVSWLVARHVTHAREEVNFSEWNRLGVEKQAHKIKECWEMVEKGDMPLPMYVPFHKETRLSEADKMLIRGWALASGAGDDGDEHRGHEHGGDE